MSTIDQLLTQAIEAQNNLTAVVATKMASINASVAAAIAAVPALEKTCFLDEIAGSDTNDGLTAGTAFATMTKCATLSQIGGILTIKIVGDYTLKAPEVTFKKNSVTFITSAARKTDGSIYSLNLALFDDGVTAGSKVVSSLASLHGYNSISTDQLNVVFPLNPTNAPITQPEFLRVRGLGDLSIRSNIFSGAITSAGRVGCWMKSRGQGRVELYLYSTTYTSDMAGRWLNGMAAAADPKSYTDVLTNLTSL
ncbi:hypothetical protein DTO96_102386 [Ephemeroptericola cinctiostellae]|uniref:Uncharacterized protein n=1 Tax=Ephemeroptericola cinctiostellae TaxID=2268024 RepID=A0A345DE43_9BURK|nr:hypothetical protein [Ephemeroptericola cinctiostellae]AXF86631.1 hypothetical protein DTO96_102386 [Ephemeroptericola cinctiostellae]